MAAGTRTVDLVLTGQSEAFTITGGTGDDTSLPVALALIRSSLV